MAVSSCICKLISILCFIIKKKIYLEVLPQEWARPNTQ